MYVEVLVKTDKAILQVCPFSQTPRNMCINQISTKCREEIKGIKISRNNDITKLMFADDRVTVADSEDAQQISIHKLENITHTHTDTHTQTHTHTDTRAKRNYCKNLHFIEAYEIKL
jgi:hypothetical protein